MLDLEQLLEIPAQRFVNFWHKHAITILLILIFNVLIAIGLMSWHLRTDSPPLESSLTLDFEDLEAIKELERLRKEYDEQLAAAGAPIRNIVVNSRESKELDGGLADDKHRNAYDIYEEMHRLRAAQAENNTTDTHTSDGDEPVEEVTAPKAAPTDKLYNGPTVLSYILDNRTPLALPIPAYQCLYGGVVVVIIHVNRQGKVIRAGINTHTSGSSSECLHQAALRAAYSSRFTARNEAPEIQVGEITYQFVQQ